MESSHRRTLSTIKPTNSLKSPIVTLFLTNLRLLDFDLLPDWPNISASTLLGNNDTRARIRGTEYALYQLFRLYDALSTSEKLQPFFPPLEPLQSINLRAALYRCLNELKKNGVLAKDVVLRKSMLDECSGEKLWEVCLAFSAIVLRKVILEGKRTFAGHRHGGPIAERLGTGVRGLGKVEREIVVVPLALAHRISLGRSLEARKRKVEEFERFSDALGAKEVELEARVKVVKERESLNPSAKPLRKLEAVEQRLKGQWSGGSELRDVLLGEQTAKDDLLYKPLDESTRSSTSADAKTKDLLQTLSRTVEQQNQRVRRWQSMHADLLAKKHSRSQSSSSAIEKVGLRFEKHRDLCSKDAPRKAATMHSRQGSESSIAMSARYDDILTSMREQLRHKRMASTSASPDKPVANDHGYRRYNSRQSSVHSNTDLQSSTSSGAPDPHQQHRMMHDRSPSETAVPMRRPSHARRSSTRHMQQQQQRSKSYTQPKVESQRGVIPLKSEVFSPVKSRVGSGSWSASGSLMATPVEEVDLEREMALSMAAEGRSNRSNVESQPHTHDSGIGMDVQNDGKTADEKDVAGHSSVTSRDSLPEITKAEQLHTDSTAGRDAPASSPAPTATIAGIPPLLASSPVSEASTPSRPPTVPMPVAARPSLAERTRMSMAFRSTEDTKDTHPGSLMAATAEESASDAAGAEEDEALVERKRRAALLERTRQSILVAPASQASTSPSAKVQPRNNKRVSHARTRSSIVPSTHDHTATRQQFRRSSIPNVLEEEEQHSSLDATDGSNADSEVVGTPRQASKRDFTPREQLFSPDAEYDSVFKPRPKVKMSPLLSPCRRGDGDEEGEGGDHMELASGRVLEQEV
ncbi:hypothetical protein LTR62_004789 [Meristemomyces frigidus]|uniref:HAUS augmin-like complex subunit 6 N-terminal domain-containing protein n=1 Tax=Meristemomyces frigidus TaxID=1508187 RepID=A0AAN7TDI1_9PEZI|nr:hypothetical protein LTR62_004789 [Meristemomyces frigidus]